MHKQKLNKKEKITVTVGIPTYNEEANIKRLLAAIVKQKGGVSEIKKIVIVDDGSRDNTLKIIAGFKDSRICVIRRKGRYGQTSAQNEIFIKAKTDCVLILEADTCPVEQHYVDYMAQPLVDDKTIGLIQGNMKTYPATTYLGYILNTQFAIFTRFVINNKQFKTPITSGRGGRMFSKAVYTKLRWPKNIPEDDYAAVWCLHNGFSSVFVRKAHCYYKRPQLIADYLKERQKIKNVESTVKSHFPPETINKYFQVPLSTRFFMSFYFATHYFPQFCYYCLLLIIEKIKIKKSVFSDLWPQTKSTKILK